MPKKIKREKELKFKKNNKILNVNNIHYFFLALLIIVVVTCTCVGVYKYSKDKYHVHADEAIVRFIYSEKAEDGYNVYEVKEMEEKDIYATFNTPNSNEEKKWSRTKFLDFNEEIYLSGIVESEVGDKETDKDATWSLELEFVDGTQKYYSSNSKEINKEELANIILKYFNQEIIYK